MVKNLYMVKHGPFYVSDVGGMNLVSGRGETVNFDPVSVHYDARPEKAKIFTDPITPNAIIAKKGGELITFNREDVME